MGEAMTRVYRKGVLEAENYPLCDVSDHLEEDGTVVWVDFCAPTKEQLHELADELGLHELAVEDALGPHQRPKLDRYDTHMFMSCHAVSLDLEAGELVEVEIDAFIHERWLITVRKSEGFAIQPVLDRWDRSKDLAVFGVSYLLYGLLDIVVDGYFDTVEAFDAYYDDVSDAIFYEEKPIEPSRQRQWFNMRRAMVRFHRLVVPLREALTSLMRRDQLGVGEGIYPYFQDVYDHILRVGEASDSLRDLVGTIVDTNLSLRDYRQNQIVKKVSSWAAIITVTAVITGFYGMNVPYPGSGEVWGAVTATLLILLSSVWLYVLFRKRDWL